MKFWEWIGLSIFSNSASTKCYVLGCSDEPKCVIIFINDRIAVCDGHLDESNRLLDKAMETIKREITMGRLDVRHIGHVRISRGEGVT